MVVGVVGSSARAAVHSLARAGLAAWAVDQFGDRDLARVAACAVCPPGGYPRAIPELARQFPPGPVLYTGGLENHPNIVSELAVARELWGNGPDALARVRDPFALFPLLNATGFVTPRLVPRDEPCPSGGRWVRKPFASGGGIGIRFAEAGEPPSADHYFQEFVAGAPRSALYCGTTLLGVTEQLIGESWLHADPFAYCGNVGPLSLTTHVIAALIRLGREGAELGLRDHWGADLIGDAGGAHLLELNPRYTASMEVIEHGSGRSVFRQWASPEAPVAVTGKAIYYAPHALRFPPSGPWDADLSGPFDPWRVPGFADIPHPDSAIERGWPVLTFFARGDTVAGVRERLQQQASELDQLFAEHRT